MEKNKLLLGLVFPFGVFSQELICNETLTKLSVPNITKHGESDVELQIRRQGIHLSAFWNNFLKRE